MQVVQSVFSRQQPLYPLAERKEGNGVIMYEDEEYEDEEDDEEEDEEEDEDDDEEDNEAVKKTPLDKKRGASIKIETSDKKRTKEAPP